MSNMKYVIVIVGALLFALLSGVFATIHNSEVTTVTYKRDTPSATTEVVTQIAEPEEAVEEPVVSTANQVTEIEIQPGDTFSTIMEEVAVTAEDQSSILAAVQDAYDFTKLQAGKLIHVVFAQDALAAVDYDLNADKKIVIENVDGEFVAKEEAIEYSVIEVVRSATIESSLFYDGASAGLFDKTLVALAEIFQWDIDFATDIQVGDSFSVVYEDRQTADGQLVSPGKILAAQFTNQGETYEAYYYETEEGASGYYSANGESVQRQFLSSALSVGYISSGFSYSRENPVTRQVTPHRALDYAAPQGTPIVATADGKVVTAGNKGGLGITVEIEHGQYKSQYAHMANIATGVKPGVTVSQGDVIGYVGSTGISTGPHLQYAFFKDGTPINPLTADLPLGESLSGTELEQFQTVVEQYADQLVIN